MIVGWLPASFALFLSGCAPAAACPQTTPDSATVVADTHRASRQARDRALRETIAKDTCWPKGAWGEVLWSLVALHQNEKVDLANARLLDRATVYIARERGRAKGAAFLPQDAEGTPWAYFALSDYVRILRLFRKGSAHHPGRLQPATEAAMKEALWFWVKRDSKVADASLDNLLVLLGTENHDLTRRPNYYLVAATLKDDPAFRERRYDDGHTAAEHAAAYGAFFRESFDVLGLFLEKALGDEDGEVGVDVTRGLEAAVEISLHILPDGVAPGLDDHAATHRRVLGEIGGAHHLLVPLGVVLGPRRADRRLVLFAHHLLPCAAARWAVKLRGWRRSTAGERAGQISVRK